MIRARGKHSAAHPQTKVYTIQNPGAYSSYELQIEKTANGSTPGTGGWVSLAEFELRDSDGQNIARDPASLLMGADEQWGQIYVDQQSVVAPSSIQIPTSLQPFDFEPMRAATIIEVSDFTGAAIQAAINQAAAMPAGTNPVVHLKKGSYDVSSTITIPAQIPITIVGDGASEHGSVLAWTGTGAGPVVWLEGPSRATLRDLSISGGSAGGVDGILIDNANQPGGRIYGYEVQTNGASAGAGHLVDAGFDISGINQTAVDINASGFTNFLTGVRVTGGPGHVQFLTGASSVGNRLFDVKDAGALLATAYWYEGDWPYVASLIDLPSTSSGSLSLASMFWTANSQYPTVQAQSFPGTLTILNSALNPYPSQSPFMSVTGDGSQTNILSAGNFLASNVDAGALAAADQTNPQGQISQIVNSNTVGTDLPAITNEVVGAQPTPAFVENQLALLRTIDTTAAVAAPAGVTDVKLLRVAVSAGDNHAGVKIVGSSDNSDEQIGPPTTVIEANGSTHFTAVGDHFFLYDGSGSGPSLKYSGMDAVAGQFGAWTPIGAEQTATGYEIAWKVPGADQYTVWNTDSSGNYITTVVGAVSGTSSALESFEPVFHQDLNSDGLIGNSDGLIGPATVIEANGSTRLDRGWGSFFPLRRQRIRPLAEIRRHAMYVAGQFGAWTPIGAEQTATGYEVAWKITGADQYTVWNTDSSGNYITNLVGAVSGTSSALELFEPVFHQDLNSDGLIGPPATVLDGHLGAQTLTAGGGTTLIGGPNDILNAGAGADTFVFPPDFGLNTINGFAAGTDVIQFDHTIFADVADVQSHMQQIGSDVVIAYDPQNVVTLHDVLLANLHVSDFLIV